MPKMKDSNRERGLEKKFDNYFARRENLDKEFWAASAKLEDEFDELMAELNK